ncbi:MAG: PIN domain-containing protein [Candidatus Aminicenantes bacterium]|nr:PIN domain-containing protein [Candidatus Aminicenantes bacterium]
MNIFIDTSAFLAVLDESDAHHRTAKPFWKTIISGKDTLLCHNYILIETSALVSRRLGREALRVFEQDIVPILRIIWVTEEVHFAAVGAQLVADRGGLSLVDCVSFEIMRRTGVRKAFAFDRHFRDYGYDLEP